MLVRRAFNSQTKQFTGKVFLSFSTKNNFMQLPLRAVNAEIMEICRRCCPASARLPYQCRAPTCCWPAPGPDGQSKGMIRA